MKRLIAILCLMLCAPAWACDEGACRDEMQLALMNPAVLGAGSAGASAYCDTKSGYLLCEDFQGETPCQSGSGDSNCRITWVISSACATEIDYSYTSLPLDGTNSCHLNESDGSFSCSVAGTLSSAQTTAYGYARLKVNSITLANNGDGQYIFGLKNASADICLASIYNNAGTIVWAIYANTTFTPSSIPVVPGTEYNIWIDCTKNTANGALLYVSENGSKPSVSATSSNSTQNYDITIVEIRSYDSSGNDADQIVIDNILVDDSPIGNQ